MKYLVLIAINFLMLNISVANECGLADTVSATYRQEVHNRQSAANNIIRHSRKIQLTRNKGQSAIEYSDTGVTELWEQTTNKQLRLVKYFNKEKRGIEYQPIEISKAVMESDWTAKRQLISDKLIQRMSRVHSTGEGCDTEETYVLNNGKQEIKLLWLPKLKLVKQYSIIASESTIRWVITSRKHNLMVINQYFARLADYQTTDYADIGDNESDPFLMRMIKLGFIEHGASGFYDAEGNDIGKHHH